MLAHPFSLLEKLTHFKQPGFERILLILLYALMFWFLLLCSRAEAYWPPLRDVTAWVEGNRAYFRVFDPILDREVTGSGPITGQSIPLLTNEDGVVAWVQGTTVYYAVYDPIRQLWKQGHEPNVTSTVDLLSNNDGVVAYIRNQTDVNFVIYDPSNPPGFWARAHSMTSDINTDRFVNSGGVVAWVYSSDDWLDYWVYNPISNPAGGFWQGGRWSSVDIRNLQINAGTVSWVDGVGQGVTRQRGYILFGPSGPYWSHYDPTAPTGLFFADPITGTAPLDVWFWDMSLGGTSWNWTFGDGGASGERSPLYTYQNNGLFEARHVVTGPGGTGEMTVIVDMLVAPSKPVAPTPVDLATGVSPGTTLDWADSTLAASYDLTLWKSNEGKPGTPTATGLTSSFYVPPTDLAPGTQYSWEVVAKNAKGSTTGDTWRFTTQGAAATLTPTPQPTASKTPSPTSTGTSFPSVTPTDTSAVPTPTGGFTQPPTPTRTATGPIVPTPTGTPSSQAATPTPPPRIAALIEMLLMLDQDEPTLEEVLQLLLLWYAEAAPTPTPSPTVLPGREIFVAGDGIIDFSVFPDGSTVDGVQSGTFTPGTYLTDQYAAVGIRFRSTRFLGTPITGVGVAVIGGPLNNWIHGMRFAPPNGMDGRVVFSVLFDSPVERAGLLRRSIPSAATATPVTLFFDSSEGVIFSETAGTEKPFISYQAPMGEDGISRIEISSTNTTANGHVGGIDDLLFSPVGALPIPSALLYDP